MTMSQYGEDAHTISAQIVEEGQLLQTHTVRDAAQVWRKKSELKATNDALSQFAKGEHWELMNESKLVNIKQSLEDSLKNQHCGFIEGVGDVYAVSEETIKDILELLKWQAEQ